MTPFLTSAVATGKGLQYSWLEEANQAVTGFVSQGGAEPAQYTCVSHLALHVYCVFTLNCGSVDSRLWETPQGQNPLSQEPWHGHLPVRKAWGPLNLFAFSLLPPSAPNSMKTIRRPRTRRVINVWN